jgi:hypothetical protein
MYYICPVLSRAKAMPENGLTSRKIKNQAWKKQNNISKGQRQTPFLDQVVEYVLLLENATTAAKVGFFLEQHKETPMVDDTHLKPLRKLRPQRPHYLIRGKSQGGRWVKKWNLMYFLIIIRGIF